MVNGMMRTLFVLSISLSSFGAFAADLPDPTRPPALISGVVAESESLLEKRLGEHRVSGLQSTIISASRRAAIIDGRTIELGAKYGDARLIEINEGSIVLQTAQKRRVMTMFPDLKMSQRETRANKAPPITGVQPAETSTLPTTQNESILSGYPKEKK